jgi:tRNA threonylcarbamoyl adenosine modification protein (Sua5/YciO/YrdC/YwlC family)
MIEYILRNSPDDRILRKASALLKQGELICIPSDTNWVLLADPYVKGATDKLYKVKKEGSQKHFSVFCKEISIASEIAKIDNSSFKVLKKHIPGNFTFIFEATKKIAKTLSATKADKEIGIRFVPCNIIDRLLEIHEGILITSQVPPEISNVSEGEDLFSYMLEDSLRGIAQMIIDPGELEFTGKSTIVSFINGFPEVIREGAGDASLL